MAVKKYPSNQSILELPIIKVTKYLQFHQDTNYTGKTNLYYVVNNKSCCIGVIAWYGPWRRYCFSPISTETAYDSTCLQDISTWCKEATIIYRTEQRGPLEDGKKRSSSPIGS